MNATTAPTRRQASPCSRRSHGSGTLRRRTTLALAGAAAASLTLGLSPAHAGFTPGFDASKPVEIVNAHTKLRADVMWASTEDNQGAFLWPNNKSTSQEFDLTSAGGGWYVVKARHSGKCLSLQVGAKKWGNGTPVVQQSNCSSDKKSNQWRLRAVADAVSCNGSTCSTSSAVGNTLVNRYTGRCLDSHAPNGRPGEQAVLQQWDCISNLGAWNVANQRFDFKNIK
jgi:hypothetical protein